jgi:lipopolysaccharide/colanic/teichoic acid biosynthesis glycosyltransferase
VIERSRAQRVFDVVVAAAGLAIAAPLLVIAALAIRWSSPGPVLYRARRVGRRGRHFTMYKLRTMHDGRAAPGAAITASVDDRVFPAGRILRRAKIDELPQLINVLRGEMSIVGPRPEDPAIVERHYQPHHFLTLQVRPGLTSPGTLYYFTVGESQVSPASAEQDYARAILPLKLALDLVYVRSAGLWYDVLLVARTLGAIARAVVGVRRPARLPERRAAEIELRGPRGSGAHAVPLRMERA